MAETFTPAVCGGPTRRVFAVVLFTLGAIAAAATLGFALGGIGGHVPRRLSLGLALAVGLVAVLRECGVVRLPIPAFRRQVPEAWRRERPLVVWSTGYGVLLGVGFGAYLPTATFWAACVGALALGDGTGGAICLAAFGLGRGLMIVGAGDNPIPASADSTSLSARPTSRQSCFASSCCFRQPRQQRRPRPGSASPRSRTP